MRRRQEAATEWLRCAPSSSGLPAQLKASRARPRRRVRDARHRAATRARGAHRCALWVVASAPPAQQQLARPFARLCVRVTHQRLSLTPHAPDLPHQTEGPAGGRTQPPPRAAPLMYRLHNEGRAKGPTIICMHARVAGVGRGHMCIARQQTQHRSGRTSPAVSQGVHHDGRAPPDGKQYNPRADVTETARLKKSCTEASEGSAKQPHRRVRQAGSRHGPRVLDR